MELRGTILSLPLKVSARDFEGSFRLILHYVCMSPRPGRIVGNSFLAVREGCCVSTDRWVINRAGA
jgi:hypothetical protein